MPTSVAGSQLRPVERDLRHPPCAHPGARKAGGGDRTTRATATARRPASERSRLGDARAARGRRVRRDRRGARSAHPRGRGRAQRRPRGPDSADPQPFRRRGHARGARRSGTPGGPIEINPAPQEVPWTVPLDKDDQHATYDPDQVGTYFEAATQAALVLAEFRAPFRGRSTPVNAWWGTFDLAVSFFSGRPADPPSDDFIMRNGGDAQQVGIGWWPGDPNHERAAFFCLAYPAPDGFAGADLSPAPGALGPGARRVRARLGGDSRERRCARARSGIRALRLPSRVCGVRLGPRSGGHRRGCAAADQVEVSPLCRLGWFRRWAPAAPSSSCRHPAGRSSCALSETLSAPASAVVAASPVSCCPVASNTFVAELMSATPSPPMSWAASLCQPLGDVAHLLDRDRELVAGHPIHRGVDGDRDRVERIAEGRRRVALRSPQAACRGRRRRRAGRRRAPPPGPRRPGLPGAAGACATFTVSQPFILTRSAGSTLQTSLPGPPLTRRSRRPSTAFRRSAPRRPRAIAPRLPRADPCHRGP